MVGGEATGGIGGERFGERLDQNTSHAAIPLLEHSLPQRHLCVSFIET